MPKLDAGRYRSRFCICFTPRFGFTVKGSKLLQCNNAATWVDEYRTGSRSDRLARLSPVNLRCTNRLLTHPNWLTNQELFDRPHLRMPKLDAGRYRSRFCICFTPRFGFTVKGSKLLQCNNAATWVDEYRTGSRSMKGLSRKKFSRAANKVFDS